MLPAISNSNTHNNNLDSNSSNQKSSLKRSSSMIFRIEHLLPSTAATEVPMNSSYLNTSSTTALQLTAGKNLKHVRAGVHVSQYTPKDTVSQKLSTISLLSSSASPAESHGNARSYCQMTQGELCISAAIMRKIKLSEDIHSYNALFEIHDGAVRIRVMKDIASNDELVAWFGEEITLLMAIPFLTPLHIQGK